MTIIANDVICTIDLLIKQFSFYDDSIRFDSIFPVMIEFNDEILSHLNSLSLQSNPMVVNLMVIVEYCPFGSLQSVLMKNRRYFVDQVVPGTNQINFKMTPTDIPTCFSGSSLDRCD